MSWCERASEFFDDELSPAEADQFRAHMNDCAACRQHFFDAMIIEVAAKPDAPPLARIVPLASARRRTVVGVASLLIGLAAAAAVLLFLVRRPPISGPIAVALAGERSLEPRLSWPGADHYRPLAVQRGAARRETISQQDLDRAERAADARALAALQLLGGDTDGAAQSLERAAPSADRESDRAAIALERGAPAQAIELADRALALAPGHAPARWNRALALRELGLRHAAAVAFADLAAAGEPGWSSEARARSEELVAQGAARGQLDRDFDEAAHAYRTRGAPLPRELRVARPESAWALLLERAATTKPRADELPPPAWRDAWSVHQRVRAGQSASAAELATARAAAQRAGALLPAAALATDASRAALAAGRHDDALAIALEALAAAQAAGDHAQARVARETLAAAATAAGRLGLARAAQEDITDVERKQP